MTAEIDVNFEGFYKKKFLQCVERLEKAWAVQVSISYVTAKGAPPY